MTQQNFHKNYHPDVYNPKLSIAFAYYHAALELEKSRNRNFKLWIPAYYLIGHALELALKACWEYEKSGDWSIQTHKLNDIYALLTYPKLLSEQVDILLELDLLNNGPGGLRYDNDPKAEFYPATFRKSQDLFISIAGSVQDRYID